jgi:hypothetical protein
MKHIYIFSICIVFGCWLFSCSSKWDQPAIATPSTLVANTTLREIRKLHFPGNVEKIIDDWVVAGVVVANDRTDNFYKTIVVQDATGGLSVRLDATALYLTYPVGMQVYIRLKGCWLGDYGGLLQLGAGVDQSDSAYPRLLPVPVPLFQQVLVAGLPNQLIIPMEVTLSNLNDSLHNCLITIPQVEFIASDTGKPWADANNQAAVNHVLRSCVDGSMYVRTSGFAKFASAKTPRGNGKITGIYTVFGWEKQLILRDTSDVAMDGLRCTGAGYKTLLWEDFDLQKPASILSITGWKNITEVGRQSFYIKSAFNQKYASVEAFACGQPRVVSWLISAPVSLTGTSGARLSFDTRDGFDNGASLKVYVSTNYDGTNNPSKSKWTLLPASIANGTTGAVSAGWKNSGSISLSSYKGNCHIAFKYEGVDTGRNRQTTTFQIDRVSIVAN